MKRLRVLLINPHYKAGGLDGLILSPPLGLFSLAGAVKDLCEVEILDIKAVSLKTEQIRKKIVFYNPDLVGISMTMTPSVYSALEVARLVKSVKNILIVAGGHHATAELENLLGRNIDIIIRGEAEITFRELVFKLSAGEDFTNVQGLSFFRNGKIFHNHDRPFEKNLDMVSKPTYDTRFFNNGLKYPYHFFGLRTASIETSRGCFSSCKFCSVKSFYKKTWRKCSEQKVVDDIMLFHKNGLKNILIVDDNFTWDVGRVLRICNLLKEKGLDDLNFFCQSRADIIVKNPEMVKKMASVGFSLVFIGIESPSLGNLADMQKQINPEQVKGAIKILHDNKIAVFGAFIIGNCEETIEDIKKTLSYAFSLDIDLAQFTAMTPLPGTEFFEEIKNRLIIHDYRKFDFLSCVFQPHFLKRSEVEKQLRRAYRQFFFRLRNWKFLMSSQNRWIRGLRCLPSTYFKAAKILVGMPP